MSELIKKPYEISVWEDVLTFIDSSGKFHTTIDDNVNSQIVAQFYDEKKICVIGSDTMTTPIRAVEPQLTSGINGTCTLTFSVYYKYYDEETEQIYDNPFVKFLVNERKIKLRHGAPDDPSCKWYDLVIKNIVEDSEQKKFQYTAQSLFINELSKSGFDLVFDPKLENSTGTITQLAKEILKESDWKVGGDCATLLQHIEEPVYKVKLKQNITGIDMLTGESSGTISAGKYIYVFYSHFANMDQKIQFLYRADGKYETNEDRVIINAPSSSITDKGSNYLLSTSVTYTETDHGNRPSFAESIELISDYRGARLVRKPKQVYDKILDRYVYVYTKDDKEYYGYEDTDYIPPVAVINYIASPRDFVDSGLGWRTGGVKSGDTVSYPELEATLYPDIYGPNAANAESVLRFIFKDKGQVIYNSGVQSNRSAIRSFAKDEEYVFRIELKEIEGGNLVSANPSNKIGVQIGEYTLQDGVYTISNSLLDFGASSWTKTTATEDRYDAAGNVSTITRTFYHKKATCKTSMSYSEMLSKNIGIFIKPESDILHSEYYIAEAQLFPYTTGTRDGQSSMCVPGELYDPRIETTYYYYPKNNSYTSTDDYIYDKSKTKLDSYQLVYNDSSSSEAGIESGYEKIRSITASESNRFNLLQTLCETFECWINFNIEHEASGKIKTKFIYEIPTAEGCEYQESDTFKTSSPTFRCIGKRQQKEITFKEFIGRDNCAGFRYGINLKGIKRTIDSEGIVSKIIVKDNSNEYAIDGFCSIARAKSNPSTENFLYNFTYYVNQGLIDINQVTNDLYFPVSQNDSLGINGYLGYYTQLARINANREALTQEYSEITTALMSAQSNLQVYSSSVTSSEELIVEEKAQLKKTTDPFNYDIFMAVTMTDTEDLERELFRGKDSWNSWGGLNTTQYNNLVLISPGDASNFKTNKKGSEQSTKDAYETVVSYRVWKESSNVIQSCNKIINLEKKAATHRALLAQAESSYTTLESRRAEIQDILNSNAVKKERLHKAFYNKYSRFIQEGSWISEDYIDDELYYLDAESTLYTSSQPMISYDVTVLELSQVEGYENYVFGLGDKTYIEDTEFFGWYFDPVNGDKTPYKEEVIVSEITINLDSPENNRLKVQNYKTQFEDLFQRVTAMTQAIEYSTGQYDKAASIVSPNGTLTFSTLQNSMANNAIVLQNAKDQSVIWDETGITTTCLTKPSEILRIVSGGIFLSKDGGSSWTTGITGSGINASCITTGQIDTNIIRIMNGIHASFRWDNLGLTAYRFKPTYDSAGAINGGSDFKAGIFTRFDQYGIYGIEGQEDFDASKPDGNQKTGVDKIWDVAKFALTWKGFSLRSDGSKGYIRISSTDDFQVLTEIDGKTISRVKIGDLSGDGGRYGMRIKDKTDTTVLETDDDGLLYLQGYMRVGPDANNNSRDRVRFGVVKNYEVNNGSIIEANSQTSQENTLSKILSVRDSGLDVKANALGLENSEVLSIFDDGTILAKRIIIKGGTIGNMTIEEIEGMNLRVAIRVIDGNDTIFRNPQPEDSKTLEAFLTNGFEDFNELEGKVLEYHWTIDGPENFVGGNKQVIIKAKDLTSQTAAAVVRCRITVRDTQTGQTLELD